MTDEQLLRRLDSRVANVNYDCPDADCAAAAARIRELIADRTSVAFGKVIQPPTNSWDPNRRNTK